MSKRYLAVAFRVAMAALLVILVQPSSGRCQELTSSNAAQFFIDPDRPVTLEWAAPSGAAAQELEYRVVDYHEQSVCSGKSTSTTQGRVQVELNLKPGYYEIVFPKSSQEFGIAALPAFAGSRDTFFAIDSAMSWLVRDPSTREGLLEVLRRSGIGMSRERLGWRAISPSNGKWDWDTAAGLRDTAPGRGRAGG